MAEKQEWKVLGKGDKREVYLCKIFTMIKQRDNMVLTNKNTRFNNTELRMITELASAKMENRRLISTQLAKNLGVTRSAVSQIVQRLEKEGVIKRFPDEVDKKIAYVELTDNVIEQYSEDVEKCIAYVGEVVAEMGEEKFETLYALFMEFMSIAKRKINE
ncbi:MAG: MarR family transcriptional regulator [Clostridia bacterium]|nr:MarR family transcriptional regulator [Clostridia bacterium]